MLRDPRVWSTLGLAVDILGAALRYPTVQSEILAKHPAPVGPVYPVF